MCLAFDPLHYPYATHWLTTFGEDLQCCFESLSEVNCAGFTFYESRLMQGLPSISRDTNRVYEGRKLIWRPAASAGRNQIGPASGREGKGPDARMQMFI